MREGFCFSCFHERFGLLPKLAFIFLILAVTLTCVAEASGSHGYTNPPPPPPPPPIRDMLYGYYAGQRQAWEEDLDMFYLDAMESSLKALMKRNEQIHKVLQEQDKDLHENMQILQELRCCLRRQYEHPRQEAAGQAQTMDEGTGPTYKLRFQGSLKARIYTKKPLLEQSNERIEIAIYRDGHVITSGHLSSVRVEIVALDRDHSCKGSWTEEDFDRQIQTRRGGQGSMLEGDRSVKLVNEKASLGNDVRFSEGSSGTRSREFVLAARVDLSEKIGVRVEEAFMQPSITVLVERSEANEKSVLPMLNDKVRRLKEIAKVYSQRLEQDGICTVQDFLKALNKDENKLRQILKMKSDKSWKVLVGHARECDLRGERELKPYMDAGENVTLFFNCIHDIVGAEFNGLYIAKDKFDPVQKALVDRPKKQAYNELEGIDFQYVMKENRPQKISVNVNAGGSSSIPMSGASPWNTSDHHAHAVSQGVAENSVPEEDATTDVVSGTWLASFFAPIRTPYGPDSDPLMPREDQSRNFWTNHRSFGELPTFPPPEDQSQIFSTAPSGGGGN